MKKTEDITTLEELAKMKRKISPDREITIPMSLAKDICYYCESNGICDELTDYGDFYYKLKKLIELWRRR